MSKFLFLGTGTSTGVPQIGCQCPVCLSTNEHDKRLRSSALLSIDGKNLLFDCGPDFRQQALRYGILHLDAILLTHEHYDHISGLDEIRPMREADVYAEQRVLDAVKYNMPYVFRKNPYPGAPDFRLHCIDNYSFKIGEIEILPIRMKHASLPVYGYRIGKLAYLTDVNEISDEECEKLRGVEILVVDALGKYPHPAHFMLSEALNLSNRLHPKQTYFTHISHSMGLSEQVQLPENVFLAYDGLEFDF